MIVSYKYFIHFNKKYYEQNIFKKEKNRHYLFIRKEVEIGDCNPIQRDTTWKVVSSNCLSF